MCPERGCETRPISPRTRTRANSPSIMRLTAPEISETENSGVLTPSGASSIRLLGISILRGGPARGPNLFQSRVAQWSFRSQA